MDDSGDHASPGAAWWLGVTFLAFWAGLLAHEGAHYATALALSAHADPVLTWKRGASAAAGPLMTLLIVGACAALSYSRRQAARSIAVAIALGAASRLVLIGIPTLLGKLNDERIVSLVSGVSARLLWAAEAVVTAVLLAGILHRSGASRGAIGWSAAAVVLGWVSALTVGRAIGLPI